MIKEELKKYKLNSKKSLETLNRYGIINGGGTYSVEYAMGNFIYFSPRDYSFMECSGWYKNRDEDYETLLKIKVRELKDNKIIVRK